LPGSALKVCGVGGVVGKSLNKAYFLKLPVDYHYGQEFILIDRKIRQQIKWKCKMH
jgi:hypothetical protein